VEIDSQRRGRVRIARTIPPLAIGALVLAVVWVTTGLAAPLEQGDTVTVSIEPQDSTVVEGGTFTVSIQLQTGPDGIDSFETYVDFNPDHLRVVSPTTGAETDQIPTSEVFNGGDQHWADNAAGEIRYVGFTFGPVPAGTFEVGYVPFKAVVRTDQTDVTLRGTIANRSGAALPLDLKDGAVAVSTCCDLDGSGIVDVGDIVLVANAWRTTENDPGWDEGYDLDGDGVISVVDIMKVVAGWGENCA
jgi:predicted RNA-binding protein with TRAM domain